MTPPPMASQFQVYVIPVATINKLKAMRAGSIDGLAIGDAINSFVVLSGLPDFFAYHKASDSVITGMGLNVSSGDGHATVHATVRPFQGSPLPSCPGSAVF